MSGAGRRLLVLGAGGQLGFELARSLMPLGEVVTAARSPASRGLRLDLEDSRAVRAAVRDLAPAVIVNAAAYTAVDRAEDDPKTARAVNAVAPGLLAELAEGSRAWLVHFSTDYVFDGRGERSYREDDPLCPVGVYGRTKAEGEQAVAEACSRHLILRTAWLYGTRGRNFPRAILERAGRGEGLRVVDDQRGAPTWVRGVAEVTAQILAQARVLGDGWLAERAGTYHVCAGGECSWHEFAVKVLELAGLSHVAVEPVSTAEYGARAPRPPRSSLDCTRAREAFGLALPPWEIQLELAMAELRAPPPAG